MYGWDKIIVLIGFYAPERSYLSALFLVQRSASFPCIQVQFLHVSMLHWTYWIATNVHLLWKDPKSGSFFKCTMFQCTLYLQQHRTEWCIPCFFTNMTYFFYIVCRQLSSVCFHLFQMPKLFKFPDIGTNLICSCIEMWYIFFNKMTKTCLEHISLLIVSFLCAVRS